MEQYTVERLFNGKELLNRQKITIKEGRIFAVENISDNAESSLQGILVPGFIDVQVNGGGGYLFNETPDVNCIEQIGQAHQQYGTTGWLVTLVTDEISQMQQAADAVAQALENNNTGLLGIHFEGPHLSVEKRGIHKAGFIRTISDAERQLYCRTDIGIKVVTLAPETLASEAITDLVADGVIVCLGHSQATCEQTQQALLAGATGFTHLFNAMSPMTSREPGMVGAALVDQDSYAGLILDGIHVHPDVARLAFSSKPKMMLVTDAMPPVGSDMNDFEFFGQTISRQGNRLTDSQGRLAGSVLDMATAVRNCTDLLGLSLEKALVSASLNPAKFLGVDDQYGSLVIGKRANMVLLNDDGWVVTSWIDGRQVFSLNQ